MMNIRLIYKYIRQITVILKINIAKLYFPNTVSLINYYNEQSNKIAKLKTILFLYIIHVICIIVLNFSIKSYLEKTHRRDS